MNANPDLGFVKPTRHHGREPILGHEGEPIGTLGDYWAWSASDLLGNLQRGILAEYLVALALGDASDVRQAWNPFDVRSEGGVKVEVKSASYIQQWGQKGYSYVQFGIQPTTAWDPHANKFVGERRRQADVYVFALLEHKDQSTINPLDTDQWTFLVLPTSVLDANCGQRKSIGLKALRKFGATEVGWQGLATAVEAARSEA